VFTEGGREKIEKIDSREPGEKISKIARINILYEEYLS